MTARAIVLYDHDCGFCRWSLGVVLRWDRGHRLWPAPIAGPVGDRWLAGMPVVERQASWHLVEHGVVSSAGRGIPAAARHLPLGWLVAPVLRALLPLLEWAYRLVADHRSAMSRFVPNAWVRAGTERVAAREREAPPSWAA